MGKKIIGIMDSGVGGLTVEREIAREFPGNDIIYIGDTARVPYGGRSVETIKQFSLKLLNFLLAKKVTVVVIACNTISATCLKYLQKHSPVPVIGVIDPTVGEVLRSKINNIGIIGTKATIKSNVYSYKLKNIKSISIACPLFVPIVEENFIKSPATKIIIKTYLKPLKNNVDGLILGCTHYPYLKKQIAEFLGPIKYFESGKATARALRSIITKESGIGKRDYVFTDKLKK